MRLNPEVAVKFVEFYVKNSKLFQEQDEQEDFGIYARKGYREDRIEQLNFQRAKFIFGISRFYRGRLRKSLESLRIEIYTHHEFPDYVVCSHGSSRIFCVLLAQFVDFYLHVRFIPGYVHVCEESLVRVCVIRSNATCIRGYQSDSFGASDALSILCQCTTLATNPAVLKHLCSPLSTNTCKLRYTKNASMITGDFYTPKLSANIIKAHVRADKVNFFRRLPHSISLRKSVQQLDLMLVSRSARAYCIRDDIEAILRDYYPCLREISFKLYWVSNSKPYIRDFCGEVLKLYNAGLYVKLGVLWSRRKERHDLDFLIKAGSNFMPDVTPDDVAEEEGALVFRYKMDGLDIHLAADPKVPEIGSVFYKNVERMDCGCMNI
ncbi:unnamed protein product [Bursaphelenchus xylophilus]|nr:unnamed protein product [Bursaphelenchus xylophilus]CAG9100088.1 unnamed protein product [Bursaphelenchus xylophilus]